jgi:hypothetical protein
MKHVKITGLCLAAVFVMSMVAAADALAEVQTKPYIIQCRNVGPNGGHWVDSQCQRPGVGEWETRQGGSMGDETFSSTDNIGKLETIGGKIVECKSSRDSGRLLTDKTFDRVVVKFFGCKEPKMGVNCNTKGAAAGEIITNELKGKIGYLNSAKQEVGLLLEPEKAGGLFAEFECTIALKVKVGGGVIDQIEPGSLNRSTNVIYQCYNQKKGIQEWTKFEGGEERILKTTFTGGTEETSAIEVQVQFEFQFDVEIVT